jgi:hypothetical protein
VVQLSGCDADVAPAGACCDVAHTRCCSVRVIAAPTVGTCRLVAIFAALATVLAGAAADGSAAPATAVAEMPPVKAQALLACKQLSQGHFWV